MIKIILIKSKWYAFVRRRMSYADEVADTEDSELSSTYSLKKSEYLEE